MKEIKLNKGFVSLVDDEDYELVNSFKWRISGCRNYAYGCARINGNTFKSIHRLILNLTDSNVQADHKDGNGLNNQRSNLRTCTPAENSRNKRGVGISGFRGVRPIKLKNRISWRAKICLARKDMHLGMFKSKEEAARAYDDAAIEHYGEFARLNLPESKQRQNLTPEPSISKP